MNYAFDDRENLYLVIDMMIGGFTIGMVLIVCIDKNSETKSGQKLKFTINLCMSTGTPSDIDIKY